MSDQRGKYLIPRRSEVRGLVGIGLLTAVLLTGGAYQNITAQPEILPPPSHVTHLEAAPSASVEEIPALPLPQVLPAVVMPVITAVSPVYAGVVTHYGVQYNGYPLGCTGEPYSSENDTIIAVGPVDAREWPCGTNLRVCGPAGCITGFRQDSCPGCGDNHLDLSEAGINLVCGDQADICRVGIEEIVYDVDPFWEEYLSAQEHETAPLDLFARP